MASADHSLNDAWRPLAEKALKGAPLTSLQTPMADGFSVEPIYGPTPPVYSGRAMPGDWRVVERYDTDDAAQAEAALWSGANVLCLVFAGHPLAEGRGLVADTVDTLDNALKGVLFEHVLMRMEAAPRSTEALALFLALTKRRGVDPAGFHAGLDPVGAGRAPSRIDGEAALAAHAMGAMTVFTSDGRPVAEAGGTPAQELAFALSSFAAYLRALDTAGLAPAKCLSLVEIALSANQDQFTTIAKLRAARRLHRLIAEACGVSDPPPLSLHATTASRMLSRRDPHTNLLRNTIAAFAAGVGGAESVAVRAFDTIGSPLARRLSRNVQTLLIEESHCAAQGDPAAGAGAIEALTDAIAQAAWSSFQENDGELFFARLASGELASEFAAAASEEDQAFASGARTMVGVTKFAPPEQAPRPPTKPATVPHRRTREVSAGTFGDLMEAAREGATLGDLTAALYGEAPQPPLVPRRLSAPFED
ncbi:MAG: methylmalonyl-CoA mutase family protein [Pseudomonadota bacterium]